MFLIIILVIIAFLIGFDKFIPKSLYPLAVFVIAISLLFHRTLITMYIVGWDVHYELYLANLVKANAVWDPVMYGTCNAMLSVVMLPSIYSIISNIDTAWVFKIIWPLLFSLMPLGLYQVFQKQTNDKIAFLSCFFFVSFFEFYCMSPGRQWIAEIFLVLLILLMIDKNMDKMRRAVLFIVFGTSLAVSHYGTSYIYMFCLIAAWLLLVLAENTAIQKMRNGFHSKFGRKNEKFADNPNSPKINRTISPTFVLLFITFTLAWYMYVSSSSAFNAIVNIGDHIASTIFTDFLNPEAAEGLRIILGETVSPLHGVLKYLHLLSQFFIFVGVIILMLKREGMKFEKEYTAFAVVNFVICFGGIALPYFASALNTPRLYHITLIFLAPFCVIGSITVFKIISRMAKASWTDQRVRSSLEVLSIFLVIFSLFNSGWVYEVAKDNPTSTSLNSTIDSPCFNDQEILGAKWLHGVKGDKLVYADAYRWLLLGGFEWGICRAFPVDIGQMSKNSYIYFGTRNVVNGEVTLSYKSGVMYGYEYINSSEIVNGRNEIYANGGAEVYYR